MLTSYVSLLQSSNHQQVKHLNASAKKRSMIFTFLIVIRKSLLYIVTVYGVLWSGSAGMICFMSVLTLTYFVNSPNNITL